MKAIGGQPARKALGVAKSARKVYKPFSRAASKNTYVGTARSRGQSNTNAPMRPQGSTQGRMAPPTRAHLKAGAIPVRQGLSRNTKIGIGVGVGVAAVGAGAYLAHRHSTHTKAAVHKSAPRSHMAHTTKVHSTGNRTRTVRRGPHGHFAGSY